MAVETAAKQAESDWRTQVSITELKPASLPPMVMLTKVVLELNAPSCPLSTSVVVAPEQAAKVNDVPVEVVGLVGLLSIVVCGGVLSPET